MKDQIPFQAGWLCPNNDVVFCGYMDHLDAIKEIPHLDDIREEFESQINSLYDEMDNDPILNDPDEHPAMHRYEIAKDDIEHEYITAIYKAGYIRIGYFDNRGIKTISFDGDKEFLKRRKNYLLKFARDYDCEASFPRKIG